MVFPRHESIREFIANGISIEILYRMMRSGLLYWAINLDALNVVRLFVASGTDPNQDALVWVVEIRNVEIVKILLERGSDPRNYVFISFSNNINLEDNFPRSV